MITQMTMTDFIATLALVIAAATFALQAKQWFDSGPRLHLSVMGDAVEFPVSDGRPKLALTVTNRGNEPTQLTHIIAFSYASRWKRFRKKTYQTGIIQSPLIPAALEPKRYWIGMMNYDDNLRTTRAKGQLYVGVIATYRDREYLVQVPLPRTTSAIATN